MTKNVNVVDDLGNRYVPTYAKRAKGLVKNGRARWVDENTICLACPPDDMNLEDAKMENKINPIENMQVEIGADKSTQVALKPEKDENGFWARTERMQNQRFDMIRSVLERMDKIIVQGDALMEVVQQIKDIPVNDSPNGGFDGQARAEAIGNIYSSREATNQKILAIYDKLYDDLMDREPQQQTSDANVIDVIRNIDFVGMMPETAKVVIDAMMGKTNT